MDRDLQGPNESNIINQQAIKVLPSMNVNCTVHQGLPFQYVSVDPTQDFVFKFVNCISEENVPQSTLIPINLMLTDEEKIIFANFPITDRSLSIEFRTLAQAPTTSEQYTLEISKFFKEFRVSFLHKIDIIEQKMTEKARQISDFGQIIEQYNKICAKDKLKEIVNDNQKEISIKSAEIKKICSEVLSKEAENTSLIRTSLERLKTLQNKIDMFLVEDFKQFQELVERKENDKSQSISNLMKLVSNKLNGISFESCERLKEQLNKVSFAFQDIQVPEIGAVGTYLETLNQNSSQVILQLIEDLAKNQYAKEEDDERENKENLVAGDLLKLISNKTNFCQNEYIEDITRVMNTLGRVLGLFLVRKPRIKTEEQCVFNNLSEKELFNLAQLAMKINRITEQHSDSYLNSSVPQSQILPNCNIVREIIKRVKGLYYQGNENSHLIESLDKILVSYPIFELLPPISDKQKFIPIPIEFKQTKLSSSEEIRISKNGGSQQYSLDTLKYGQVVSEILDNSLGYRIKVKFTRPISVANNYGFRIGLIQNSEIDSKYALMDFGESGLCTHPREGAKIILKGGKLTSEELSKTTDCIEFRFCIQKQLFLYADSSYSNINLVESKHFDPSQQYRFAVCLANSNTRPSDMLVSVSEFGTIDPEEIIQLY